MGYSTAEAVLLKSINYFNSVFEEQGSPLRLVDESAFFCLRMAKKKNGKPNCDYPSKSCVTVEIDLAQNIIDVDFTSFCIVYESQGIFNCLAAKSSARPNNKSTLGMTPLTADITNDGYAGLRLDNGNMSTYENNPSIIRQPRPETQSCCNGCAII